MNTIISRAIDALHASGHDDIATELPEYAKALKNHFEQLAVLLDKQRDTVRSYINLVQSRCSHKSWLLTSQPTNEDDPSTWGQPTWEISCYSCGHTLCDEEAYKFGKKAIQSQSLFSSGSDTFMLSSKLTTRLASQLTVKEIKDVEVHKTTLRGDSEGADGRPTVDGRVQRPEGGTRG